VAQLADAKPAELGRHYLSVIGVMLTTLKDYGRTASDEHKMGMRLKAGADFEHLKDPY